MNTEKNYAELYYHEIAMDAGELEKNLTDFPSSSVTHLLWLIHLKKNNDPRFEEVAKKAGIYLYNPGWIEFQLSKLNSEPVAGFKVDSPEDIVTGIEENPGNGTKDPMETFIEQIHDAKNDQLPVVLDAEVPANKGLENDSEEIKNEKPGNTTAGETLNENNDDAIDQETSSEDLPAPVNEENHENLFLVTGDGNEETGDGNEASEGHYKKENDATLIDGETEREELPGIVNEEVSSNLLLEVEDKTGEPAEAVNEELVQNNQFVEAQVQDKSSEVETTEEKIAESQIPEPRNSEVPNADEQEIEIHKDKADFNETSSIQQEYTGTESDYDAELADEENEDLSVPFEPLHTVDYFASQGIKLSEEALNNDQLGKQVKSFTAWLKSMKKLHPGQLPEQNEVIEKLIQSSSEESNQSANVLTEAMAEVLVKQGKRAKAIEMYEKLSLINTSKSAYFAAKIESLKTD